MTASPFNKHRRSISDEEAEHVAIKATQEADRKGLTGRRRDAYIYGTKRRAGWRPKRER